MYRFVYRFAYIAAIKMMRSYLERARSCSLFPLPSNTYLSLDSERINEKTGVKRCAASNDHQHNSLLIWDCTYFWIHKIQKSFHTLEIRWCERMLNLIRLWQWYRNTSMVFVCSFRYCWSVFVCSFEFSAAARHLIWMKWSVHLLVNEIRNLFFSLSEHIATLRFQIKP